ncbi:hypothetical protein K504DRAFT_127966 [Pleomassaria siparia CBS 279.74]|uniref:Galactose oxidase n=1 Tax=Pleomassaria siparia CBS 279.74 TaxID=1314801 RepID=A0A6G1KKU3_9PLEO|nr:hypothetical protein K504DRAFT_127966 [Pleomassaria siparia CBS 279.74]
MLPMTRQGLHCSALELCKTLIGCYRRSLARRNHTVTVVNNKAYIFGGDVQPNGESEGSWKLTSNEMHVVTLSSSGEPESDYHLIPAIPSVEGGKVPVARTNHSACAINGCVAIYGGIDQDKQISAEGTSIWLFDPKESSWTELGARDSESKSDAEWKDITKDIDVNSDAGPHQKRGTKLFAHGNSLILYGGRDTEADHVWKFDMEGRFWTRVCVAPVSTSSAAFVNNCLYLISASDPMSSQLHYLDLTPDKEVEWKTITFPTNPLAPGPRPRDYAGLLPITTGYGRNFLVYFLGSRGKPSSHDEAEGVTQWSDMWTLQIPSSDLSPEAKLSIKEVIKPAKIKDAIRSALPGAESGVYTWAEVQVEVPDLDQLNADGKLHPGPRSMFGCDVMQDGGSVVLWGGEDAKGERIGDGWIIKLE